MQGTIRLMSPTALVNGPAENLKFAKWSKLELMQYLLKEGWFACPKQDLVIGYRADGQKSFNEDVLACPKSYTRALVLAAYIFAKPGGLQIIYHGGSNAYYNALVWEDNLSMFAGLFLEEITDMLRAQGKNKARRGRHELQGQEDDECDESVEGEENAGQADDELAGPPPPTPVAPHRPLHGLPREEQVRCTVAGMTHLRVDFDNYSHTSGDLRAFLNCGCHDGCRTYQFVKNFPSQRRVVAWLFAWGSAASRWKERTEAQQHMAHNPADDVVIVVERAQFL